MKAQGAQRMHWRGSSRPLGTGQDQDPSHESCPAHHGKKNTLSSFRRRPDKWFFRSKSSRSTTSHAAMVLGKRRRKKASTSSSRSPFKAPGYYEGFGKRSVILCNIHQL